jgi:pSer/pThr/pTyr-binding forkhead associated (FHA) protein
VRCSGCGGNLEATASRCPACGAGVDLGRLTGILGAVCRACDAYNDPGARLCVACGASLSDGAEPAAPRSTAEPRGSPAATEAPAPPGAPLVKRFPEGDGASEPRPQRAPPPPRARTSVYLERGAAADGAAFHLDGGEVAAGRAPGAMSFPGDPCLASHHATFFFQGDALHVRDVGAPGGVFLRLRGLSVPLRPGDQFAVGDRLLRYAGPLAPAVAPASGGTRRLGTPRPPPAAVAVEERLEGGMPGRVFVRTGPTVRIGRSGCAVALDDPTVAAAHAEILLDGEGGARLRDLGTPGGTYLRLPPHAERELRDGDRVRLGREILRIALG